MKTLRGRLPELLLSALVSVALVACADDVTNTDVTNNVTGARTVADLASAGKCDSSALGEIVLNGSDGALYVCNGRKWLSMKGDPGESGEPGAPGAGCTATEVNNGRESGYALVCDGEFVGMLYNGAQGVQGNPGAPGAAGTSCTAAKFNDGLDSGVVVSCGGAVVDTIRNGSKGDPGDAGASCSAEKFKTASDSGVVVSCDGAVVDTIRNGSKGDPGNAGASCSAEKFKTALDSGVVVSCDGAVVDTIRNGAKGDPGDAGAGCTSRKFIDAFGATSVIVTCGAASDTLYSSRGNCGGRAFDATTSLCDVRDGKLYRYVTIGSQTWMAENLNYEYKVNGSTYGSFCYQNSADSCAMYGRFYTWAAAMDTATTGCGYGTTCAASSGKVQGICPGGWHLPDTAEWHALFAAVGGADSAGTKLKSTSGWYNGNGTDAYGFSALPSGFRYNDGYFYYAGNYADFWSSSEDGQNYY